MGRSFFKSKSWKTPCARDVMLVALPVPTFNIVPPGTRCVNAATVAPITSLMKMKIGILPAQFSTNLKFVAIFDKHEDWLPFGNFSR